MYNRANDLYCINVGAIYDEKANGNEKAGNGSNDGWKLRALKRRKQCSGCGKQQLEEL